VRTIVTSGGVDYCRNLVDETSPRFRLVGRICIPCAKAIVADGGADYVMAPYGKFGDEVVHAHDMVESGTTKTCDYSCKIFRCSCGQEEIRHMASYGCPIGRSERLWSRPIKPMVP
jgi:hypothetical protein